MAHYLIVKNRVAFLENKLFYETLMVLTWKVFIGEGSLGNLG
jgi:hypothetical protein